MTLPLPSATRAWSDAAVDYLLDASACPVCARDRLRDGRCPNCGATIDAALGAELASASSHAAAAIRDRQAVVERVPVPVAATLTTADAPAALPTAGVGAVASAPVATPASSAARPAPATATAARPESTATVQSVLAVAGAGLLAVAAVVFAFFNPDLRDVGARSAIMGAATLVFLGGAWWLARKRLRFSAESVGGLGLVFVALDIASFVELTAAVPNAWLPVAIGTAVGAVTMAALGLFARIRIWVWASLTALATVPAMFGYAGETAGWALVGHLSAAFAAFALIVFARRAAGRFDGALTAEQRTLTAVQITAAALAVLVLPFVAVPTEALRWLLASGTFAAVTVLGVLSARHPARRFWSLAAGFTGVVALAVLPFATGIGERLPDFWMFAVLVAAAQLGLVGAWVLAPRLRAVAAAQWSVGALFAAAGSLMIPVVAATLTVFSTIVGTVVDTPATVTVLGTSDDMLGAAVACAAAAAGQAVLSAVVARRRLRAPSAAAPVSLARLVVDGPFGTIAAVLAVLAWLLLACLPTLTLGARIGLVLALALAVAALERFVAVLRPGTAVGGALFGGAHLALVLGALLAGTDATTQPWAGLALLVGVAALALVASPRLRFLYVGAGFAYALTVVATVLGTTELAGIAQWCLTTAVGLLVAIVATFLPRVGARSWWALLAVAAVPFGIGIVQVVFERSGWTALSTGLMLLLAITLVITRRPGLGIALRTAAAALVVPSAAVVAVCLGAEVLSASASPVVLPVIAALVAVVLPATAAIGRALARHGVGAVASRAARIAIEVSSLATAAIAVLLSLVRSAAGLETTFIVFVLLGLGATALAVVQHRRLGWWLAGASFTGALWSVWGLAGVTEVEAYLVPPGLAAALVGAWLTVRGARGVALVASGLLVAIVPTLAVLAISVLSIAEGDGASLAADVRGWALIGAAWLLVGLGLLLGRGDAGGAAALAGAGGRAARAARLGMLRPTLFATAIVAAVGAALQGARLGIDGMPSSPLPGVPLALVCAGVGLLGGAAAFIAGRALPSRSRWLTAPAFAILAFAAWPAIRAEWPEIWSMWALMLALLAVMLLAAVRSVLARTTLPPVWFLFALAFVTAVVAWSPRELRVEWFSVPLGVLLLAAGAVALRRSGESPATGDSGAGTSDAAVSFWTRLTAWPAASRGSWALLAPGLVVLLSASIAATFTDPQTWRAILVILFALTAILVGSARKLAAPFLIGIVVLPIENVVVFAVQIGRGIESMPWWITLAVVGAVLLIIAVTTERRTGAQQGIAARLGDLR
ncbi:SCO7613 C-terminal domain-containing membrane protein [Agromyces sp. NPDC058136]|uniref:SCO7613 C-terminal domain-containing membrane protein n=1 Tax=Agromyces sp. NPDC058136 TaxID=3346354 RepID=UPI0036D8E0C3